MKLVIATQNPKKLKEIQALLDFPGLDVVCALDLPGLPEIVEDGATFEENAIKKAVTLSRLTSEWSLADDSGLEVDALQGAPGVYSARYAGEPVNYAANNEKLLRALRGVSNRQARFRCVIALSSPEGEARCVEGVCEGVIIKELKGHQGFGYDPLFRPAGYATTFAEMEASEKNRISHRGRALAAAKTAWAAGLSHHPRAWSAFARHD